MEPRLLHIVIAGQNHMDEANEKRPASSVSADGDNVTNLAEKNLSFNNLQNIIAENK